MQPGFCDTAPEIVILPAIRNVLNPSDDGPRLFRDQRHCVDVVGRNKSLRLEGMSAEQLVLNPKLLQCRVGEDRTVCLDKVHKALATFGPQAVVRIQRHDIWAFCCVKPGIPTQTKTVVLPVPQDSNSIEPNSVPLDPFLCYL